MDGTQKPIAVSLFGGVETDQASWYASTWLGEFYALQDDWIYHSKLGWLYLKPNANGGFWFWDPQFNGWWWSSKDTFPYAYLSDALGNGIGWLYFELKDNPLRIYRFNNQQWTTR